jgi:hypothetical protein
MYWKGQKEKKKRKTILKVPGFLLIKQKSFGFFRLIVLLLTIG